MKRFILHIVALTFLLNLNVFAQQEDKGSLFAGYAFNRLDHDEALNKLGVSGAPGALNFHGLNAAFEFPLAHTSVTDTLNIAVDLGAYFTESDRFADTLKIYTATAGPQFTNRSHQVLQPFVRALFGVSHIHGAFGGPIRDDTGFAMLFGGGLDAKVGERVAVRIAQLDYMGLRHEEVRIDNFRFATGIVILF